MRTNQPVPPIAPQIENEMPNDQESGEDDHALETKPILIPAQMDDSDMEALDELILVENVAGEDATVNLNSIVDNNSPGEVSDHVSSTSGEQLSETNEEQVKTTVEIDEDIEMTYIADQVLLPTVQTTPMVVKRSDELSGKMPFMAILDRQDVSVERKK